MAEGSSRWTPWHADHPPADHPDRVRIYCFPHAGGSASTYLPWLRSGSTERFEFVPVELPGRGTRRREPPATTIAELADGFVRFLSGRPAPAGFALFGHSLGGKISYEVARQLDTRGRVAPLSLIISGTGAPGFPDAEEIYRLPDGPLLQTIAAMGGTPVGLLENPGLRSMALSVLRADLALLVDYDAQRISHRLSCPLAVFGGAEDTFVDPACLDAWLALTSSPHRRSRVFPGGHFFLTGSQPQVLGAIIEHLRCCPD